MLSADPMRILLGDGRGGTEAAEVLQVAVRALGEGAVVHPVKEEAMPAFRLHSDVQWASGLREGCTPLLTPRWGSVIISGLGFVLASWQHERATVGYPQHSTTLTSLSPWRTSKKERMQNPAI